MWPSGRAGPAPHCRQDQADNRFFGERAGIPGIPIAFHLAPHPADRILADRAAGHGRERPAHSTRVGPRRTGARDQRIRMLGSSLVGPQHCALPLCCLALRGVEPGARYLDLHSAESPHLRSRSVAVPVAGNTARPVTMFMMRLCAAVVARA